MSFISVCLYRNLLMIKYVCDEHLLIMCLREKVVEGVEITFVSWRHFLYYGIFKQEFS